MGTQLGYDGEVRYVGHFWNGYWLSPTWLHLRFWLGFLIARVLYPTFGIAMLVLALAVAYVLLVPGTAAT